MQFRFADIAYLFALVAASFGAFGPLGLFVAISVEFVWFATFRRLHGTLVNRTLGMTLGELLVVIAIVGTLSGLLLSATQHNREAARRARCVNNLSIVSQALLAKTASDGRLPQAIEQEELGNPFHSWRLSVLPLIGQQAMVDAYDRNEPWDSPQNSKALNRSIAEFECPSDPPLTPSSAYTNYFAVVGSKTAWPEDRRLSLSEITDGRSRTILLLEVAGWEVPLTEPRDLTDDEAFNILVGKPSPSTRFAGTPLFGPVVPVVHHHHGVIGYFYKKKEPSPGVHAAFADGTVRFLPVPLPEEMAKALLTANAGDHVDWDEFERLTAPQLDYAKIYATIAFAIVALWPARRALRKRPA